MTGSRSRPGSVRRARRPSVDDGRPWMLRRWDGISRTCRDWDSLRRDPEIWERNGNCLVHLYAKGESKRGPSFKLPFSALLSAGCFPLIERFLVLDGLRSKTLQEVERWDQYHSRSTVELFIPTPSGANEKQALQFWLAVRNLFAWILGRPMVGEQLGATLVTLMHSLDEFRSTPKEGNADDLMAYLYQAGYLNLTDEPSYALAILHLAESFKMKDLYARAFAHCVGMHERLFCCPESQHTTVASRRLIRQARVEMNASTLKVSDLLTTFLDNELSEAHMGIPSGTRAHLERFRSFLLSFYATKLGYYPPKSFSAGLLRSMTNDFEALYELLVDSNYKASDLIPSSAVGGICTEQLVQSFDQRHRYKPLEHPLPRLPQIELQSRGFRRLSWLPFSERSNSQRQVVLAALIKASNWTEKCFKNDLVRAYRKFEEDSIFRINKADRHERVSVADARKVRWILIYTVYQVLRRATTNSTEVHDEEAPYHLNAPMDNLPPWKVALDVNSLVRQQTSLIVRNALTVNTENGGLDEPSMKIEIVPDVDYFAITHRDRCSSMSNISDHTSAAHPSRSSSFSIGLKRNSTFRKSLRRFRTQSISESQPSTVPSKLTYHEIVVEGYGNGIHDMSPEPEEGLMMKSGLAGRSDSTASSQSNSSTSASSADDSIGSTVETLPSTAAPSPTSTTADSSQELEFMLARWGPQDKTPVRMSMPRSASDSMTLSTLNNSVGESHNYVEAFEKSEEMKNLDPKTEGITRKRRSLDPSRLQPVPALTGLQRRYTILGDIRRKSSGNEPKPAPRRMRENSIDEEQWSSGRNSDDWTAMQAFMDGTSSPTDTMAQYSDLGGLTEMR